MVDNDIKYRDMIRMLDETGRTCFRYGYSLSVIRWMKDELGIETKKEAIDLVKIISLEFIKDFNSNDRYDPYKIEVMRTQKINKSISDIVKHFTEVEEKKVEAEMPNIEVISDNFIRIL